MPEQPHIYIGTAGWSYKDWEGIVYPAQIKKSQHPVEYLARYIDVIEINTSFYGHIKPEWGKLWCRKARAVNPAFVFTAKLNRAFTHSPIAVVESTSAETIRANPRRRAAGEGGPGVYRGRRHAGSGAGAVPYFVQEHQRQSRLS